MVTLFCPRPGPDAAVRGLDLDAVEPGQFVMLWIPRMDEKPYTIGYLDSDRIGITVQRRGPFSRRLFQMQPGDKIGLRGPYGRPFWDLDRHAGNERVTLLGGGCGMATIGLLAERLPAARIVQGARSERFLLYRDRFPEQVVFTDDGSAGRQGFPTQWLEERIERGELEMVYTCGPELMMAAVVNICRASAIPCQVSMERYMKCGIGVCGQCDCDGKLVCRQGPTFDLGDLAEMPSFGKMRRDKTGRALPVGIGESCPSGPQRESELHPE
jgi:dihydroorotate dehydrogenase electron transfer subunit